MSTQAAAVDPRAVVDPSARVGEGSTIGPYVVIGPDVVIGARARILSHAVIEGPTTIGDECIIHPFASIGSAPQDLKYRGERSRLEIGPRNTFREGCTINRGTAGGGGVTRIGEGNLFMTLAHVAHDCQIGDGTIFANAATLAGHVSVGSHATIGAYSGVHQFCRVADHAFIGGYSVVTQDALPYVMTVGNRATTHGINVVGLKRHGFPEEAIAALRRAYLLLFRSKLQLEQAIARIEAELGPVAEVGVLLAFIRSSERGFVR